MTYFKRNIDTQLLAWKDGRNRKPLLVRGARQIGKSSSIRNLAKHFKYFIEVNLESNKMASDIFDSEYDVKTICERLSVLFATPVVEGETLIFLDEIQVCQSAIKSLWFFKENLPEVHVVAAGSLLEFALKEISSYGVGRISSMFMYPMSFCEFLDASGKEVWADAIKKATPQSPLFDSMHRELVSAYRTFLLVGGMPASVRAWVETHDYNECMNELSDIQQSYYDDFPKYSNKIKTGLLRNTLQSVILQTGKKFVFSRVPGSFNTDDIKKALTMLSDAGIITKVSHTAANGLPLGAETNEKFVKYNYLDTGLLLRILELDFGSAKPLTDIIVAGSESELVNKGSLAELSVGLELLKASNNRHKYELHYWENLSNGTNSEVDYVIPHDMKVLPIEVKSGTSGKMKSLRLFMQKKDISKGIRTSLENFNILSFQDNGTTREIEIMPIYAIGNLLRQ
ncbi:MAG: ATP-binding protein [Clostridium sp.]|nr:ATP-binding protein [Clostridium sp.]